MIKPLVVEMHKRLVGIAVEGGGFAGGMTIILNFFKDYLWSAEVNFGSAFVDLERNTYVVNKPLIKLGFEYNFLSFHGSVTFVTCTTFTVWALFQ